MTRRASTLLGLTLAVTLIAGCAPIEREVEPPVASPEAPSQATPTPDLEPVRAFDGDCDRMLTLVQRDALLEEGTITSAEQLLLWDPERPVEVSIDPIGTLGGLECTWFSPEGKNLPEGVSNLTVSIVPASVVPNEYVSKYSVGVCEPSYDASLCRLGRVVGDTWVSATVGYAVTEAPDDLLAAAIDAVAENLPSATQPRPLTFTEAMWSLPDCVLLGEEMGLEDMMGAYRHGYWEGSEQPAGVLLDAASVLRTCPVFTDVEHFSGEDEPFRILAPQIAPGLHWQWDQLRGDAGDAAIDVEIEGAVDAFVAERGYGSSVVLATDGTNVVSLSSQDVDFASRIVSRILAVLTA